MKTLEWVDNKLKLIDQRKLPDTLEYIYCSNYKEVIVAIKNMTVRGAPAIGVSAAFGMALASINGENLDKVALEIKAARPTAVNLFWAVDRILASDDPLSEALKMYREDMDTNRAIGKYGAEIIDNGDTILTHCNAGALACVDYGTALGVIRAAYTQGKNINVICDETRPRGQGASLSVWEMQQENIPVKLIPDAASGFLMSQGLIDKVVIGADRIARGGVVNKVGSFMVALAAKHHNIPFYVAAPYSTFDNEISIFEAKVHMNIIRKSSKRLSAPTTFFHTGKVRVAFLISKTIFATKFNPKIMPKILPKSATKKPYMP